jgi:AGCS family alanine or glycine:cation symporter
MISWSYYGEQCMVYLAGEKSVFSYKVAYCALIVVATLGFVKTDADLDNVTSFGTGVMLFGNIPILWFFGYQAMRSYKGYIGRLKSGEMV